MVYTERDDERDEAPARAAKPHPLCALLRQLRTAAGLSLAQVEQEYGISAVVLGAYERGDRIPPLPKLERVLTCFGYRLDAVPIDSTAIRLKPDVVADLRAIANQLERTDDVPALPAPAHRV